MQAATGKKSIEANLQRYCTFRLSGRLYGVDIGDVKEINTEVRYTPIFHATDEIKGYINIRGQIYLLLELRKIFGFEDKEEDENTRVLLFMPGIGELCGILVDNIEDVVSVDESLIENRRQAERETPEGHERRGADVGEGVCKLENELLIILSARKLVQVVTNLQNRNK